MSIPMFSHFKMEVVQFSQVLREGRRTKVSGLLISIRIQEGTARTSSCKFQPVPTSSWCQSGGLGCRQRCECEWRTTKLPGRGGGQQERPGKEEPLVGRRKEGSSQYQHCWSQFLVGFLHPVRWHPPDNGRQPRLVNIHPA